MMPCVVKSGFFFELYNTDNEQSQSTQKEKHNEM